MVFLSLVVPDPSITSPSVSGNPRSAYGRSSATRLPNGGRSSMLPGELSASHNAAEGISARSAGFTRRHEPGREACLAFGHVQIAMPMLLNAHEAMHTDVETACAPQPVELANRATIND